MTKNPLTIVVIVIAIAAGGAFLLLRQSSSPQVDYTYPDNTNEASTPASVQDNSRYIEYSKAALDQAASGKRVLFFYANWCSTCRPTDANFKQNLSKIPEDVTVIRVNYNDTDTDQEEKDLAKKYGITYQHTFVQIDQDGREVTKWNGGQIEQLLANLK